MAPMIFLGSGILLISLTMGSSRSSGVMATHPGPRAHGPALLQRAPPTAPRLARRWVAEARIPTCSPSRPCSHLLRRPPAGFEELVTGHFRRRGQHVLRACEAYLEGCRVGTLDGEARATDGSSERPCSAGFRVALRNVLPRLVDAFAGIGVQGCEQFHRFRTLPSTLQFAATTQQQPVMP
ncbi:putative ubiquitin-conjugating enzyme E2 23 [Panicum miliaceum]|uniref:Ubiquitin-conjugating enzyme E2 23 n=1 Tax=Panicum miliaceum TaxID=4540 RepID=A0A3L6TJA7_PANMI|nr:putative ubiquitin-conjugating enzyme E2 23 [Panicum miliaceum]